MSVLRWTTLLLLAACTLLERASAFQMVGVLPDPDDVTLVESMGLRSRVNRNFESRIVGGVNAPAGRYPYFTFLEIFAVNNTDGRNGTFICSATLIWEDMLLGAAHCLIDLQLLNFNLTGVDAYIGLERQSERDQAVFRQVSFAVPHPLFNPDTEENDVMVLKLASPVESVQPVGLNLRRNRPFDGEPVEVFGFGTLTDDPDVTTIPNDLQTVSVLTIPFGVCNGPSSYNGRINDALMICAGVPGGGRDACFGDSGSPLIIPGTGVQPWRRDVVVGVVSFGEGCAQPNFPGIYTRISAQARFIFNQLCRFAEDPPEECDNAFTPAMTPFPAPVPAPVPGPNLFPSAPFFFGDDDDDDKGGGGKKSGGKKKRLRRELESDEGRSRRGTRDVYNTRDRVH